MPKDYFMCSLSRIHCSISFPVGRSWNWECRSFPNFFYPMIQLLLFLFTYRELLKLPMITICLHKRSLQTIWRVVMVKIKIGRLFIIQTRLSASTNTYQFHHGFLSNSVKPQHVRILNHTRVVTINFSPSIGVMPSLHVSRTTRKMIC